MDLESLRRAFIYQQAVEGAKKGLSDQDWNTLGQLTEKQKELDDIQFQGLPNEVRRFLRSGPFGILNKLWMVYDIKKEKSGEKIPFGTFSYKTGQFIVEGNIYYGEFIFEPGIRFPYAWREIETIWTDLPLAIRAIHDMPKRGSKLRASFGRETETLIKTSWATTFKEEVLDTVTRDTLGNVEANFIYASTACRGSTLKIPNAPHIIYLNFVPNGEELAVSLNRPIKLIEGDILERDYELSSSVSLLTGVKAVNKPREGRIIDMGESFTFKALPRWRFEVQKQEGYLIVRAESEDQTIYFARPTQLSEDEKELLFTKNSTDWMGIFKHFGYLNQKR